MKPYLIRMSVICISVFLFSCMEPARFTISTRLPMPIVTRPMSPGNGYIWIEGEWFWNGKTYLWRNGYWTLPSRNYDWIPGRWKSRGHGWHWKSGHWR